MRLKITLSVNPRFHVLPLNYQYPVSSWIYQRIAAADKQFGDWLHNAGFQQKGKRYKLFTFSNIFVPKREIKGDRLHILSPTVSFQISFYADKTVEYFILGVFDRQEFEIGDKHSKAKFFVEKVEALPVPEFNNPSTFRCLSPICVAKPLRKGNKLISEYISPADPDFEQLFIKNLLNKYNAISGNKNKFAHGNLPFTFELLEKPKSRLITIKSGTREQTKVRGFLFPFKLNAPVELMQLGYESGFGEKNSLGFGCVERIK